jgi:hypothetical protein
MLRFYADRFVTCLNMLHAIEVAILQTRKSAALDGHAFAVKTRLSEFIKHLEELKLPLTRRAALELFSAIEAPQAEEHSQHMLLLSYVQKMTERLRDELEPKLFLYVDSHDLFEQPTPPFGEAVSQKFPSALPEIEEAGKCLALQRPTASVMHLMRVLELGLHSLADTFNISFANANWQTIIDQIGKQVRQISLASHGVDWKVEQQFYSEATAHFLKGRVAKSFHAYSRTI